MGRDLNESGSVADVVEKKGGRGGKERAGEAVVWPAVGLGAERVEGVGESAAIVAGAEHSVAVDGEKDAGEGRLGYDVRKSLIVSC